MARSVTSLFGLCWSRQICGGSTSNLISTQYLNGMNFARNIHSCIKNTVLSSMNSSVKLFGFKTSPLLAIPEVESISVRTKSVRNNFPRANERKRVKVHGWKTRLSTLNGRKILMRRILKGRFVLSH